MRVVAVVVDDVELFLFVVLFCSSFIVPSPSSLLSHSLSSFFSFFNALLDCSCGFLVCHLVPPRPSLGS